MIELQDANSFGVVVVSAGGKVLLREVAGHYGGYRWTFPKSRSLIGETPHETAQRAVREATGYRVELIDTLPQLFLGTTSKTIFYIGGPIGQQGDWGKHTASTRWVSFDDADTLIAQTTTSTGRERDLQILRAGRAAFDEFPWELRPRTCKEDWETQPMPDLNVSIPLSLRFDHRELGRIKKGFFPTQQEEKWFIWCDDNVINFHRSWTGNHIYQVFLSPNETGAHATHAIVNRAAEQYAETDDDVDRQTIAMLIDQLLVNGPEGHSVDALVQALALASQPNYLGTPSVVAKIIADTIDAGVKYESGQQNFNGIWDFIWNTAQEITGGTEYTLMPGWHTPNQLGNALVKYLGVREEEMFANDLDYFLTEALTALVFKARDIAKMMRDTPNADWSRDVAPKLDKLCDWAVAVFLGTNSLLYPDVTLHNIDQLLLGDGKPAVL